MFMGSEGKIAMSDGWGCIEVNVCKYKRKWGKEFQLKNNNN